MTSILCILKLNLYIQQRKKERCDEFGRGAA